MGGHGPPEFGEGFDDLLAEPPVGDVVLVALVPDEVDVKAGDGYRDVHCGDGERARHQRHDRQWQ